MLIAIHDALREASDPLTQLDRLNSNSLEMGLLGADQAEVRVPADRNGVDGEHAVLQRHELEVDHLYKGPDHPVGLQRVPVGLLELLLGRGTFEHSHARQEHADEGRCENQLVAGHARQNLGVLVGENDFLREDLEPCRRRGAKDDCIWGKRC